MKKVCAILMAVCLLLAGLCPALAEEKTYSMQKPQAETYG